MFVILFLYCVVDNINQSSGYPYQYMRFLLQNQKIIVVKPFPDAAMGSLADLTVPGSESGYATDHCRFFSGPP
jgi:hypothetical protein